MAQNIVFRVVADTQPAVDGMNKLDSATKNAKNDVNQLDQALGKIGAMAAGAFAVDKLIAFGKEAAKVAGEMESIRIRLNSIAGGANEGGVAMQQLQSMANKLGLEFKGLASEYVKFVGAAKASGIEVAKADKIFKSMSVAIAGSGASAEQSNRAFTALTQMMGKGKISAEELRGQLGEALPSAFGTMAKSMGVTTAQLDKMMANGELMAADVLPKFATEMEKAFGADAEKLSKGLNANINRLTNSWDALLTQVGQSKITALAVDTLSISVESLSAAWALVTANYGSYQQAKINAERDAKVSEQMQPIVKQIRKEIDSYGDAEIAIEELGKKYATLSLEIEDADRRIEKNRKRRLGVSADKAITSEFITQNETKRATLKVMEDELNILRESQKGEVVSTKLTKEQEKSIERRRKQLEKIQELRAKEEGIEPGAGQNAPEFSRQAFLEQFFKWQDNAYERNLKKRLSDIDELEEASNYYHSEQMKLFNGELGALDMKHRLGKIKEEEYLKELLELHKKYGVDVADVEDKITLSDAEKKQIRKAYAHQMAGETASAVTNTILAYKQKEIDGEKEMVENQRQQGLISQEQYDQKIRAIKRKEAIADRIAAIAQIAINTAIAISNPTNAAAVLTLTPLYLANAAIQTGIVLAQPMPYNKGTKRVPMMRGAVRGRDSVHAILTPDERVVPADINTQPGYSALLDLAQDKKISDKEAGFLAELATSGMRRTNTSQTIDPDTIGRAIAKYIPHTNVAINERGIAVITERSQTEIRRLRRRIS
jgi:tape measure domain-containing protein